MFAVSLMHLYPCNSDGLLRRNRQLHLQSFGHEVKVASVSDTARSFGELKLGDIAAMSTVGTASALTSLSVRAHKLEKENEVCVLGTLISVQFCVDSAASAPE